MFWEVWIEKDKEKTLASSFKDYEDAKVYILAGLDFDNSYTYYIKNLRAGHFTTLNFVANKANKLRDELSSLDLLLKEYPNILIDKDRWEHERFYAYGINNKVTDVEICHSCGCCSDAPLLARPYLTFNEHQIYSYPVKFCVGEREIHGGNRAYKNWHIKLEKANIPEAVIAKVRQYFRDHPPLSLQEDPDYEVP